MSRTAACTQCTHPGGIRVTKQGRLYSHDRTEPCPGSRQRPTETGACGECTHPLTPVTRQGVLQDHDRGVRCPGSGGPPAEGATPEPTAREQLAWLKPWDWSDDDMSRRIDAYRDEVARELGRDLLRDGLGPFLVRLVGAESAAQVLAGVRGPACGDQLADWTCSLPAGPHPDWRHNDQTEGAWWTQVRPV